MSMRTNSAADRIDWVDYAKGFCIIFVVMMHSTLGVESAAGREGWLHAVVEFARPFRMPDFFLISGLFLANVIDRDWRTYLDRKVVHFVYFYVLWVTIQFAFKAPSFAAEHGWSNVPLQYAEAFVEPFGTLWFIYLLPIFFVVVKATRSAPVLVVWLLAAALEISHIHTGWTVIDEFASRFVYFYTGYVAARYIFAFASEAQEWPALAMVGLVFWGVLNGIMVFSGLAILPVLSLLLGFAGAAAVVAVAALMAKTDLFAPLRYCGEHSIVIYLAFFLPMAISRTVMLKLNIISDVGTIAAIVTFSGVVGALIMWWLVRHTFLRFLFERPEAFWIAPRKPRVVLQPAE